MPGEIPQYTFRVAPGWSEVAVSIADLGGTEVDLRFQSADEGDVSVVVAPVMRFADIDFNAQVKLEELVSLDALIRGFAPELIGEPLGEDDLVYSRCEKRDGLTYYAYELSTQKAARICVFGAARARAQRGRGCAHTPFALVVFARDS